MSTLVLGVLAGAGLMIFAVVAVYAVMTKVDEEVASRDE